MKKVLAIIAASCAALVLAATFQPAAAQVNNHCASSNYANQLRGGVDPAGTCYVVVVNSDGSINVASGSAANNPTGITPTDRTITSATGASQTVMAANASRKGLTLQNTGNANCGVNPTGGTAAIGGAGTLTLLPGGSYTPRVPTLAAVTAICTAGQPLYASEQ